MLNDVKYISIIALLVGIIIGSNMPKANADGEALDKKTFLEGMALCGILANERHDPLGAWGLFGKFRSENDLRDAARTYANSLTAK
jgi:hypothetical protein